MSIMQITYQIVFKQHGNINNFILSDISSLNFIGQWEKSVTKLLTATSSLLRVLFLLRAVSGAGLPSVK